MRALIEFFILSKQVVMVSRCDDSEAWHNGCAARSFITSMICWHQ